MPAFLKSPRARAPSLLAGGIGLCLALSACISGNDDSSGSGHGSARFTGLQENPKWYRTFDSTSNIAGKTTLVFSWNYADSLHHADSFYVSIDTLWMLPQDVQGDTSHSGDWDLQLCPNGSFCLGGLVDGVHGGIAFNPFPTIEYEGDTDPYATEHHIQFFPALKPILAYGVSPDSAIFGALMILQSRSGDSPNDTVFVFGTWKLPWDEDYPPPMRPVNGYLPKHSDFTIVNGKVRYTPPNIYNPATGPEVL